MRANAANFWSGLITDRGGADGDAGADDAWGAPAERGARQRPAAQRARRERFAGLSDSDSDWSGSDGDSGGGERGGGGARRAGGGSSDGGDDDFMPEDSG